MIGQPGPGARIISLLGFPGDNAALDIDLPTAGAGAVHAVGGPHDLVMRPALAIGVLPLPVFNRRNAVALRERAIILFEEGQAIEEVTHLGSYWWAAVWAPCSSAISGNSGRAR